MVISIDLGGTKIRAGLVDGQEISRIQYEMCKSQGKEEEVIDQLVSLAQDLMNDKVSAICIGVPSVVDPERGIVYDVTGIPSWKEVHLKEIMEERLGKPVFIDNDCNCFALGEYHFGKGKGSKSMLGITLGTGVGSGLILDGHLYRGVNTGAGEIGAIPYLDKDYEYYCSSRFFTGKGTSGKEAAEKAMADDPAALELFREFGVHVGKLMKLAMYAYDPSCIVIGGSIANAFQFFEPSMKAEMKDFAFTNSLLNISTLRSESDYIILLGASMLCAK